MRDIVMHKTWGGLTRIRVYHGSETVVVEVTEDHTAGGSIVSQTVAAQQLTPDQADVLGMSLIIQANSVREHQGE